MNKEQKEFIRKKLIPFIRRENGKGFSMWNWLSLGLAYPTAPKCGTIACIGGSIELLMLQEKNLIKTDDKDHFVYMGREPLDDVGELTIPVLGKRIGLSTDEAHALFYDFGVNDEPVIQKDGSQYGWPLKYRKAYVKCRSSKAQAEVAISLLRAVVRTNGKVLRLK